jgi:hypothetical protein
MTEIYQSSVLTISALSSADCDSGILNKLPDSDLQIGTYWHPDGSDERGNVFVGIQDGPVSTEPHRLSSRGWAF